MYTYTISARLINGGDIKRQNKRNFSLNETEWDNFVTLTCFILDKRLFSLKIKSLKTHIQNKMDILSQFCLYGRIFRSRLNCTLDSHCGLLGNICNEVLTIKQITIVSQSAFSWNGLFSTKIRSRLADELLN